MTALAPTVDALGRASNRPYPEYRDSGVEWLGDVPEHWGIGRLKTVAAIATGDADTVDRVDDGRYPFFVRSQTVERIDTWSFDGEAVLTAGDGAVGEVCHYVNEKFDYHQRVYKFSGFEGVIGNFFYHYFSAMFRFEVMKGTAKSTVESLRLPMLQDFPVLLPTLDEQRAIAAFLDRETERIDALVEKKRRLIERLREYRAALITRTVTRGLPPEAARAAGLNPSPPLKPSGVEWLGAVPEYWEVKPLRSLVSFRGGATPNKAREEFWDGDIPWVSPKDMKRASIADSEDHVTTAAVAASPITMLPLGTVLVVVRGMILAHSFPVAVTTAPVTINQDMKALFSQHPLSHTYLYWYLVGTGPVIVSLCDESAHGTRKLESATLALLPIPVPRPDEQLAIVAFLDGEMERIDTLVRRVESNIERLQEHRTALITAAVTGKIDVREAEPEPVAAATA